MRAAWIVVAGFAVIWVGVGWGVRDQARSHDFLSFYTGAHIVSHGEAAHLYDEALQTRVQKQWAPPNAALIPANRPPFYVLLQSPLAWLSFDTAFAVYIPIQIAVLLACWFWAWRRFGEPAVVFAAMSMPAALGIAHGQDNALFLAVLIGSYALAANGKDFASGAVLGLLLAKFHLAPLWPLALLILRRWKMLAGFAATGIAAAAVSLAMVGIGGIRAYASFVQNPDFDRIAAQPEFMIGLRGLDANLGVPMLASLPVMLVLFVFAVRRAPLWRLYPAATAASLLLPPHVYGYDATMLLLGLWLAAFHTGRRFTRSVVLWLFTPFAFSFTLAGKPWAAIAPLSLMALLAALALERK